MLLSCHGFWLFLDQLLGVGIRWRSKHHTETRSQVLGAWSPSLDGDLDPVTVEWWVGLLVSRVQAGHVFRGTQLGTLIRESRGDLVRLVYNLAM